MDAEKTIELNEVKMDKHFPVVSVCVLTYNPILDKLLDTLYSITKQENVEIQIVISDDGSVNNYFDKAVQYLDSIGFYNYKLCPADSNQGTVKNTEKALLASDGAYVKLISPGDCLTKSTILAEWVSHLENSKRCWSFSDAIYYEMGQNGQKVSTPQRAHPQIVSVYNKQDDPQSRWNYVVLDDIALGAATLCERELMIAYIQRITGYVKYAEDNIYRIMMFDGIVADYFPQNTIWYEYSSGISTGKEAVWSKRLADDWQATDRIMLSGADPADLLQKKMAKVLNDKQHGGKLVRKLRNYAQKGKLHLICKNHLNRRMTSSELYSE